MEYIFLFILGLLIGSFLNVCIYRLPLGESVVFPPSHCMHCGRRLTAGDLVPVLSFLFLGGKCRYCKAGISPRYAFIELLTGFLFIGAAHEMGFSYTLAQALVLICFMVVITWIDIDHQLILDKVLIGLAAAGFILMVWFSLLQTAWLGSSDWLDSLLGFLLGGGVLFLLAVVSGGGMGGGDIKFAAVLGLWFGWETVLLILFLSFLLGGFFGLGLLLLKRKGRKDFVPFGPFIALSALIVYFYGADLILWYIQLL